ncbi:MAG: patatin-like phospholipase family protein [bacterium]|nr:patatin-like phospholipase family protein [bacterium]
MSGIFDTDTRPGTALCLSGGGYRAMLFHTGVLWRLYELGRLEGLARVSSVSGGSLTAAVLALKWERLSFDPARTREDFVPLVVEPLRAMASRTVDRGAVLGGALWFGTASSRVRKAYSKHLFGDATLQDLPDEPRFVINATNVQSGALWRFSKPYMRDYRVGKYPNPRIEIAQAVAASSAFPPVLSPVEMELDPSKFEPGTGQDMQREPFTRDVVLSDGGVYDNMGLETASSFETLIVSDAGGKTQPEAKPKGDWARHAIRVLGLIDNQVRSLRKRELMAAFDGGRRKGVFWSMSTNLADYGLSDSLDCPHERTLALAAVPTRLAAMDRRLQNRVINWGYAACDAGVRRRVDTSLPPPQGFPYPSAGV